MTNQKLTLKALQDATNAPIYLIQYLKACNRLPIIKQSSGRGYPTYYSARAIDIVKHHMQKGDKND